MSKLKIILSSLIILILLCELTLPQSIQDYINLKITINSERIRRIIRKMNSNSSISIMKILKMTKQNTKLMSQSGIIEIIRNSNYCLFDLCLNKSERDDLIRVFSNQISPLFITIGDVRFKVISIDIPIDTNSSMKDNNSTSNNEKIGKVVLESNNFYCFIFRSGNFLLYICGIELDLIKVYNEQREVLMMLKDIDNSYSNFIIF